MIEILCFCLMCISILWTVRSLLRNRAETQKVRQEGARDLEIHAAKSRQLDFWSNESLKAFIEMKRATNPKEYKKAKDRLFLADRRFWMEANSCTHDTSKGKQSGSA